MLALKGALEFCLLPEFRSQWKELVRAGSCCRLHSFEILGQDFLIFGSLTKAAAIAVTPVCQIYENTKAVVKVFIFHQYKMSRWKK